MIERAHERVGRDKLYSVTGIQTMPINTIFQLLAEADGAAARAAERIALVPDLFGLWLTGTLVNEITAASTTGLLDARSGGWARGLIAALGLPQAPFAGEPVEPGTALGPLAQMHASRAGAAAGAPVWTVAGHDTAAAFVATPLLGPRDAVLSSGTWSLLGLEVGTPFLGADAAELNLTNERGLDATIRLLRNVMGLWLLQECRRQWAAAGTAWDYDELHALAAAAPEDVALFDPDDDSLLAPGDMPARIAALCRVCGQDPPATPGEVVRSILVSLACKYRLVLERLERVTATSVERIHVVGGGARNQLLCRLTAELCGRELLAGSDEATALGNVLIQARAAGALDGSLAGLREVAAASTRTVIYEPSHAEHASGRDLRALPRRDRPARADIRAGGSRPIKRGKAAAMSDQHDYEHLAERLAAEGRDVDAVERALAALVIETPSWGYGDSGTRFGVFPQAGRPRDVFERFDDAAEVHRLTGTAPAVATALPLGRGR